MTSLVQPTLLDRPRGPRAPRAQQTPNEGGRESIARRVSDRLATVHKTRCKAVEKSIRKTEPTVAVSAAADVPAASTRVVAHSPTQFCFLYAMRYAVSRSVPNQALSKSAGAHVASGCAFDTSAFETQQRCEQPEADAAPRCPYQRSSGSAPQAVAQVRHSDEALVPDAVRHCPHPCRRAARSASISQPTCESKS